MVMFVPVHSVKIMVVNKDIYPLILNHILDWDERTAIQPVRLTLEEKTTGAFIVMIYGSFSE